MSVFRIPGLTLLQDAAAPVAPRPARRRPAHPAMPILPGLAGESKSYAERLFSFPDIGALSEADALGVTVNALGPVRSKLIKKGMIYSPAHGDMAFTVPLFDEFMLRAMPQLD